MKKQMSSSREGQAVGLNTNTRPRRLSDRPAATFALAILVAVWCFAAPASAAGQDLGPTVVPGGPAGSYQQSCTDIKTVAGHVILASCRTMSGSYKGNRFEQFYLCSGDISNNNGNLTCAKTQNSAQFKDAVNAFAAAEAIVLGAPMKNPDEWVDYMHGYGMGQQFKDGIKLGDAFAVVKKYLSQQGTPRRFVINNAYQTVYGSKAEEKHYAFWDAPIKANADWYATIVPKLRAELNSNKGPYTRDTVINVAYYMAMGRLARDHEMGAWKTRTEDYQQMLEAARAWLYSDAGNSDLREAISTAFKVKMKKNASEQEITDTANLFRHKKLLYVDMIK